MRKVNEVLLNHFISGNGLDFESPILTNEVRKNKSTKHYVDFAISTIWNSKTYLVDGAIFYPKGAFYPVKAHSTPKGLTSRMCSYKRK